MAQVMQFKADVIPC